MTNAILRAIVLSILTVSLAYGAQGLKVVSSPELIDSPMMQCRQNGESSTALKLNIRGISSIPIELCGKSYDFIDLASSEKLTRGMLAIEGRPDLPVYSTMLAIPNYVGMKVRINSSSYEIIDNIDIAPVQAPVREGEKPIYTTLVKDDDIYSKDAFYPEEIITIGDPFIIRDYRGATVTVSPVQYNPVTRQLRIYTDLDFDIVYEGGNPINAAPVRREFISDAFEPLYRAAFANYDQICSDLPTKRLGYIIITHDMFADSLDDLAVWKHHKGYAVTVTRLSEISANPSYYQIMAYIDSAYTDWEIPPEYILLIGDVTMPNNARFPDYTFRGYTSDHKYGCVDGEDYFQDIFVSRWAIDNTTDLHKIMRKTLMYEQNPSEPVNGWMQRGLSVAGNPGGNPPVITPRLTTLWVRQKLIDYGFIQCDTCFDWSGGGSYCNVNVITTALNNGTNVVSYRGIAGPSGWAMPSYSVNNLNALSNDYRGGLMVSIVCGTGHYGSTYTDPCFGEAWLRGGYGSTMRGGVAFYGTTDTNTHTQWNNPLMVGFYWGMFDENLTHFGQSIARSKLMEYMAFPQHQSPGGNVEKYIHSYNPLGDPELDLWRGTPTGMYVNHPETLPISSNCLDIQVADQEGYPLENAYVSVIKKVMTEEEVFSVGKTDVTGHLLLPFNTNPTQGDMELTVTHRDFLPYRNTIMINRPNVALGYISHTIDDDNNGYSHGNNDGKLNPSEYVELSIRAYNGGTETARGVEGTIAINDEYGTVLSGVSSFGNIPAGSGAAGDRDYVIVVSPDCPDGYMLPVELTLSSQGGINMESLAEIEVTALDLEITNIDINDSGGDGKLDPDESALLTFEIRNNGIDNAVGITGILDTTDPFINVNDTIGVFGTIPGNQSGNNSEDPITLSADVDAFEGHTARFMLKISSSSRIYTEIPFNIEIGSRNSSDPTGPDNYGYYIYDDTDESYDQCPSYDYVDISATGTRVAQGDDVADLILLPFDFNYYGETYSTMTICSNGFVALDTVAYDMGGNHWALFFNWPIPDPGGPGAQISPFWDDLNGGYTGGRVCYEYDQLNHRLIIEWHNVRTMWDYNNTYETFELMIFDSEYYPTITGDCPMAFYYEDINDNDSDENYSTVGFESMDEFDGLQYLFCRNYGPGAASLVDQRALRITTNTGRGRITGKASLADDPDNSGITVYTSTGQKGYTGRNGDYSLMNAELGGVNMAFLKKGYFPRILNGIEVGPYIITRASDVELEPAPVPANLTAEGFADNIVITWETPDPSVTGYNVYRDEFENGTFRKLNEEPLTDTTYTDVGLEPDQYYWYCAEAVYENAVSKASAADSAKLNPVGADEPVENLPGNFALRQNYPNPFNPKTVIKYELPVSSHVKLEIFNLMGQTVETLIDGQQPAGYKSITWDGSGVASGIYFYKLSAGGKTFTRRMTLLK